MITVIIITLVSLIVGFFVGAFYTLATIYHEIPDAIPFIDRWANS